MEGNIFDIQRFSVHDGPGIRTTVFFKGCPLTCLWCHNPESQRSCANLGCYASKCRGCGACVGACPNGCHTLSDGMHAFDREKCVECGKCAEACVFGVLEVFGNKRSAESVLDEVKRDRSFYKNSCGGMTVSGGEPLMQPDFLVELLRMAKEEGIHTCIETSGFASEKTIRRVAQYVDIFLFDIKATDDSKHKELTGVPFEPIRHNLMLLDSLGKKIVMRCPLIPDVNTDESHIENIARIATELENLLEINVMAYHTLGNGKYDALGMENKMAGHDSMTKDEKSVYIKSISDAIAKISDKKIKVC